MYIGLKLSLETFIQEIIVKLTIHPSHLARNNNTKNKGAVSCLLENKIERFQYFSYPLFKMEVYGSPTEMKPDLRLVGNGLKVLAE